MSQGAVTGIAITTELSGNPTKFGSVVLPDADIITKLTPRADVVTDGAGAIDAA